MNVVPHVQSCRGTSVFHFGVIYIFTHSGKNSILYMSPNLLTYSMHQTGQYRSEINK